MAIQDPVPCSYCGKVPSECSCTAVNIPPQNVLTVRFSAGGSAGGGAGGQVSVNGISGNVSGSSSLGNGVVWPGNGVPSSWEIGTPVRDTATQWQTFVTPCSEHVVDPDTVWVTDDYLTGECSVCRQKIKFPHVPGGFFFEKAGMLVGRAMSLDEGDEESLGELLAELTALESRIGKEVAKYKRTLKLVELARDLAIQHSVS